MTGAQLVVLALLVAAFAAGWVAGRNREERLELPMARLDLLRMIDEGAAALDAALSGPGPDGLARLDAVRQALADGLGEDHPLADDLQQARAAMALSAGADGTADVDVRAAIEAAARNAAVRYHRTAAAIRALQPEARRG